MRGQGERVMDNEEFEAEVIEGEQPVEEAE